MPRAKPTWAEKFWLIAADKRQLAPVAEQLGALAARLKYAKTDDKHPFHTIAKAITSIKLTVLKLGVEDLEDIKRRMFDTSHPDIKHYFNTDNLLFPHGVRITVTGNVDARRNQQPHEYVQDMFLDLIDKYDWDVQLFFTQSDMVSKRQLAELNPKQQVRKPYIAHRRVSAAVGPKLTAR